MKQKILEAFKELGFQLQEVGEGACYQFTYEGTNMLYMVSDNDETFFNIAAPGVYDTEEGDIQIAVALKETINSSLKYVKAYSMGDSVWIFHEHEVDEGSNLEELIAFMVQTLDNAVMFAHVKLAELNETADDSQTDND